MAQTKYTTGETVPLPFDRPQKKRFGGVERLTRESATDSAHEVAEVDQIISDSRPLMFGDDERFMIYVLLQGDEPVYVGQTSRLMTRLEDHAKTKDFDRYWFTRVPESELSLLEARYIVALNPRLNMVMPKQSEFLTAAAARDRIVWHKLRRAVKMGIVTGIHLHLGVVYRAEQIDEAIELLGAK